jgi:hypothetical protein
VRIQFTLEGWGKTVAVDKADNGGDGEPDIL